MKFLFLIFTGKTRYSIKGKITMDTSCYPKLDFYDRIQFKTQVESAIGKIFPNIPQSFIACKRYRWFIELSEEFEIEVQLLAIDEDCKDKILFDWSSDSFLANINLELCKIKELADGKVEVKNIDEPVAYILTGN